MKRFTVLIVFVLFFAVSVYGGNDENTRRTVHFDDMVYTRPDVEAMNEAIIRLTNELKKARDFGTVLFLSEEIQLISEHFETMYALSMLRGMLDIDCEFYAAEQRFTSEASVDFQLAMSKFSRELAEGRFADEYREYVGGYYFNALLRSVMLQSEDVADYRRELSGLYIDYERMITALEMNYRGEEQAFIDLYLRIIELHKKVAEKLGFECAAEMIYSSVFNREYGPAEAWELIGGVREYIVPLIPMLFEYIISPNGYSLDAVTEAMPAALAAIDEELAEVWEFMRKYGLHDFEPSPNKVESAFMIGLSAYDTAFIFSYWDTDNFNSTDTLFHEFGHFYDYWLRSRRHSGLDMDTTEFYAYALSFLMQSQYGIFTDYPDEAGKYMLAGTIIHSIAMQSMLEEFQLRLFEADELDSQSFSRLFGELRAEYGFGRNPRIPNHDWIYVSHLYYMPFYTISYVTSSAAALQLWDIAQYNKSAAIETYLNMIRQDQNAGFSQLLNNVSLNAPHDSDTLRGIAQNVLRFFKRVDYSGRGNAKQISS
jgi:oligoendopeptidase F